MLSNKATISWKLQNPAPRILHKCCTIRNYEGIYQENELQSSCTIEYTFSIPNSMRAFDQTDLLVNAIIVNTYNVGLGGELPTFVEYRGHFNTVFIRNGQHVVFILPLTSNNIIAPFLHRFSFLQLLFYNISGVSLAITTESSTNVCFLL